MLDAIMSPEREYRYFSFDSESGPDQSLASMDNGSGDEYSITFTGSGVFLRSFTHEAPLSPWVQDPPALWPGILAGLPAELTALAREPAFAPDDSVPAITVALWRQPGDGQWHYGRISYPPVRENQYSDFDGSDALFAQLDGRAERLPRICQLVLRAPAACRCGCGGHRALPAYRGTRQRYQSRAIIP